MTAPFVRIVHSDGKAYSAGSAPLAAGNLAGTVSSPPFDTVPATLITAPADKMSPRSFLEMLGLTSAEEREAYRRQQRIYCINAIRRGDTYGFPPSLVRECRDLMAEQETGLTAPAGWNRVEL